MNTAHSNSDRLFIDQPLSGDAKSDLLMLADEAEREGWIDTSLQLALALCLAASMVICGFRVATPAAEIRKDDSAMTKSAATLAVGAVETQKAVPPL